MKTKWRWLPWPEFDKEYLSNKTFYDKEETNCMNCKNKEKIFSLSDQEKKGKNNRNENPTTNKIFCNILKTHLMKCPLGICNVTNMNHKEEEEKDKKTHTKKEIIKKTKNDKFAEVSSFNLNPVIIQEKKNIKNDLESKSKPDPNKKKALDPYNDGQNENENNFMNENKYEKLPLVNMYDSNQIPLEEETLVIHPFTMQATLSSEKMHQLKEDLEFLHITDAMIFIYLIQKNINHSFMNPEQVLWVTLLFSKQYVSENNNLSVCCKTIIEKDKNKNSHSYYSKWSIFLMQQNFTVLFDQLDKNLYTFVIRYTMAINELQKALANIHIDCAGKHHKKSNEHISMENSLSDFYCTSCKGPEYCYLPLCNCTHYILFMLEFFLKSLKKITQQAETFKIWIQKVKSVHVKSLNMDSKNPCISLFETFLCVASALLPQNFFDEILHQEIFTQKLIEILQPKSIQFFYIK